MKQLFKSVVVVNHVSGNGSFGVVFEVDVFDNKLQRRVTYAMKVQIGVVYFEREVKIMSQMESIYLVKIIKGEVTF